MHQLPSYISLSLTYLLEQSCPIYLDPLIKLVGKDSRAQVRTYIGVILMPSYAHGPDNACKAGCSRPSYLDTLTELNIFVGTDSHIPVTLIISLG